MGLVLLIIIAALVYLFIGYVIIRLFDDEGLVDADDALVILIIFFPIALIVVGIREGGDKLVKYVQDKLNL